MCANGPCLDAKCSCAYVSVRSVGALVSVALRGYWAGGICVQFGSCSYRGALCALLYFRVLGPSAHAASAKRVGSARGVGATACVLKMIVHFKDLPGGPGGGEPALTAQHVAPDEEISLDFSLAKLGSAVKILDM